MSKSSIRNLAAIAGSLLLGSLTVPVVQAAAPLGDLWQVTSQMQMVGLPFQMPAQTQEVCSAKGEWTRPPAGNGPDQSCVNTEFRTTGATSTWKIVCQASSMTGTGEITRAGADAYAGTIKFSGGQGEMTINLTGRRVRDCNNPP